MSFSNKLVKLYFDFVYNTIYDFTTAKSSTYSSLQKKCVGKFRFEAGDSVLCVGIGTGNEVFYILDGNRDIKIVGVDSSERALRRAYKKCLKQGKEINVLKMDANKLQYSAETFNKVLCLHVMDFIEDDRQATREILRVLKKGGQFVITYPSDKESIKLATNLLNNSSNHNSNSGKSLRILPQLLVRTGLGILYMPLLFRVKKEFYSHRDLEVMFTELKPDDFRIEEYPMYNDFIVYGMK